MSIAVLAPVAVIREAVEADIPAIVAMGVRFLSTPPYDALITPSAPHLDRLVRNALSTANFAVWVAEADGTVIGVMAMFIYEHLMSGDRIASEMAWWVDPQSRGVGVRLLRRAERWATDQHADVLQMIAPTARVGQFYEAIGYRATETTYQRRLT